jgi:hypothetical protein
MNSWFKRNGIHFLVAAIFLVISFVFFTPAFQGKTLGQNDVTRAQSTQKEINDYKARDTTILWTDQVLGGMPTYQIWAPYSGSVATHAVKFLDTVFPAPIYIVFLLLFGAYFLFNVLKVNPWLAAAGALAFTFSSYNIIYISAGHSNQEFAIALFAPILASIIMVMRGRHLTGASLLALFLAIEIKANHIQMTYYLLLALLLLVVIEIYHAVKNKTTAALFKSLAYIAAATVLAVLVNASLLWSTFEYSKDSIRGQSNLTQSKTEASNGVPRSYAYEFSEGVAETLTFLVPNAYGGGSRGPEGPDSHVAKVLTDKGVDAAQAQNIAQGLTPLYWGEKTFTEGPWYFGAVVCFLFVFGLFVVKDRIKWWLLATIILTMLLSFGGNFPYISDLFFDYFPLYNKFRAVESILTVAMLCFPVLALLAVNEAITDPDKTALFKKAKLALYITGGLALLLAVAPEILLSFRASNHQELITKITNFTRGDAALSNDMANALVQDRIGVAKADAIRSLIFVLISFALLWAFLKQKVKPIVLSIGFLVLILVDLYTIDRRYLKDDEFVDKQEVLQPQPRDVDQAIMRDKDPDYRVIDVSQVLMQDATTPYFHKSIGGYSAARLKRFDELVTNQFDKSINPAVLNMLNTKYIITAADTGRSLKVVANPEACGHAWFVKRIQYAANADKEMQALTNFKPKDEAIVDQQYKALIDDKQVSADTTATIKLVRYTPDYLVYQSNSTTAQTAVFSEIYYNKGWKMLVDGVEKPYFRADYVLRAAQIPAGNHKIEFVFHPASYYTGERISMFGSVLLILGLGGAAYSGMRKRKV